MPVWQTRKLQHLVVLEQEHHSEEVHGTVSPSAQVETTAIVQRLMGRKHAYANQPQHPKRERLMTAKR